MISVNLKGPKWSYQSRDSIILTYKNVCVKAILLWRDTKNQNKVVFPDWESNNEFTKKLYFYWFSTVWTHSRARFMLNTSAECCFLPSTHHESKQDLAFWPKKLSFWTILNKNVHFLKFSVKGPFSHKHDKIEDISPLVVHLQYRPCFLVKN